MSTVSVWAVHNCHCVGCVNPSQNPRAENWLFTSCYLVRITDLAFAKPAVWLGSLHRKCFPGSNAVSGLIFGLISDEQRAHGHVSPWSPNGSAPKIAPASDARLSIQTVPVSASGPENDSACNGLCGYGATCCAASSGPFSGADCRSNLGAKSISMEKSDFFNLISGSVLFLHC